MMKKRHFQSTVSLASDSDEAALVEALNEWPPFAPQG